MRFPHETHDTGRHHVRVAESFPEKIPRRASRTLPLERGECVADLELTAAHPIFGRSGSEQSFVKQADALVCEPGRESRQPQTLAPDGTALWQECALGTDQLVQVVDDAEGLDQRAAVVEDQRRHAAERVVLGDALGVAPD
jgi:hypothetical protein